MTMLREMMMLIRPRTMLKIKKQMWLRMNMRILQKKSEKATNLFSLQFGESTDNSMISHLVSLEFPQMLVHVCFGQVIL